MRPVIPGGSRPPQQPTKPFDPKDPSTWPKLSTRQYAERAAAAGYSPLTGKATGTPVQPDTNMYNAGTMDVLRGAGNALIKAGDFVFKEPAKSIGRTLSTQNIQTALNPRSTATQRINAIGEDALNIIGLAPGIGRGAAMADDFARPQIQKAVTRLAESRATMGNKLRPTASLDNYILHGGVAPERLVGDSIDPTFVRGGDKFIRRDTYSPSVKTGPNAIEDNWYLEQEAKSMATIAGDAQPEAKVQAQQWLDGHEDILRRIKAGEDHGTGVHRLNPGQTYRSEGGMYLLDVPPNLRSTNAIAPAGEIQFWGQQKPVGFVRNNYNGGPGVNELEDKAILQMMIDDADIKAGQTQKLANMIARARGTKVTPAYKRLVEEVLDRNLGGTMMRLEKNPKFGQPRENVEYFTKYPSENVPKITNYDQIVSKLRAAKTEEEVFSLLEDLVPDKQLDIMLRSGVNSVQGGLPEVKRRVVDFISGLDPSYSRLKSVPRNGPIIVDKAPYPKNLSNWDSLKTSDGQMFAFANKFMDRRTPAEVVEEVYDPDLFKLMFKNPEEGYRILNERLANLGRPRLPDWSSLTPDEMGFATILNRNTPAEEVKRKYIQHNLEMEKSLNQGMRDIAGAMAERSGMDVTRAYDFAEDYQKWQRRGGRNPGSN